MSEFAPQTSKNLIDGVPTQQELADKYGGEISQFNTDVAMGYWGNDAQKDSEILTKLRDSLVFSEMSPELGRGLYDVAAYIARSSLSDASTSGDVFGLLSESRYYARPLSFTEEDASDTGGKHSARRREMALNLTFLDDFSRDIASAAEASGFEWRDSKDAVLFAFMGVAAHETGHAILSGIGKFAGHIKPNQQDQRPLASTQTYLQRHPELSMTETLEHDINTHEERFAEGLGILVTDQVLATLGYTPDEIAHLRSLFAFPEIGDISQGHLGYLHPLTPEQMADQLAEIQQQIFDSEFGNEVLSQDEWKHRLDVSRTQQG